MAEADTMQAPFEPATFLADLEARRARRALSLVRLNPRSQPIASDIDPDSCLRRQVYEVTRWQDKEPIPADRQGRLEAGNDAELAGRRELERLGFKVIKEQVPFELIHRRTKRPVLRGRIDGFIEVEVAGRRYEIPLEIKSLVVHAFNRVFGGGDPLANLMGLWWARRWPWQLLAYLIGYGQPWGFLFITDLCGTWKPVGLALDLKAAERVWAFAEAVADAIEIAIDSNGEKLPAFSTDPTECARCPFFGRVCQPPVTERGAAEIDEALLVDLEAWNARRAAKSEYEALDRRIKEALRRHAPKAWESVALGPAKLPPVVVTCGPYMVKLQRVYVKGEAEPRPARADVRCDVVRVGDKEEV